jgi:Holliday junction resolvasome RuvABC endonuclease subunit
MTKGFRNGKRVLAIDPTSRGFGFAILEGPGRLVDWGVKEARTDKRRRSLRQINDLLTHYPPELIVVEDCTRWDSRRSLRVERLIGGIQKLAARQGVAMRAFSRSVVRRVLCQSPACTKHQIALVIAKRLPELAPRVPPPRQPWMSEDYRMSIFDAVAVGLTYFHAANRRRRATKVAQRQQ